MYKKLIRPILFACDAEKSHYIVVGLLRFIQKIPCITSIIKSIYTVDHPQLQRNIFGLTFANPVGLAAGFDKNGALTHELAHFGFGFVEIGTVTPSPQDGNPRKRLFRLIHDESLINRMGFNNDGIAAVVDNLRNKNPHIIVGGNIGKNTNTSVDEALTDYTECFESLFAVVDYFVVNISCPNVGNTAKLTSKDFLVKLLHSLQKINHQRALRDNAGTIKPVLIKISPDLSRQQLDEIIEIVAETNIDGVVACNTSTDRSTLKSVDKSIENIGNGGLSGKSITNKSTEVIRYLVQKSDNAFVVIGIGGIHSEQDALDKLQAGASLIQIYTGFIYEGPALVKRINKAILKNQKA